MIRLISGENSFKIHEYLNKVVSDFSTDYPDGIERFEVSESTDQDLVLDSVRSISFLSPKKLVIIEDFFQNKAVIGRAHV